MIGYAQNFIRAIRVKYEIAAEMGRSERKKRDAERLAEKTRRERHKGLPFLVRAERMERETLARLKAKYERDRP